MRKALVLAWASGTFLVSNGQGIARSMQRLPDTGETTSYTSTFGEDADYTINAPFFTLNGGGIVTDTITGLMWQQGDGGEMTIEIAIVYCDTLTLGGFTDWRLPNAHEAFSILDHQHANPATDPTVFTTTAADYWWTSTRQANDSNKVWVTNAGGGIGNHPKSETLSAGGIKRFHVRAVRDQAPPPIIPQHFTVHADGTATDELTGLVWQRIPFTDTLAWEDALGYADTLTLGGFADWRLPNIKELRSINEESLIAPSLDGAVFPTGGIGKYWSSTTLPNQTTKAWYLYTQFGITTYDAKTLRHSVLCVRGGNEGSAYIVERGTNDAGVRVFPVPTRDVVHVEFDMIDPGPAEFTVRNVVGSIVKEVRSAAMQRGRQRMDWDTSVEPGGVYFLTIAIDAGPDSFSQTAKVLVANRP